MSFNLIIRADAQQDIEEAVLYYENQRDGLGGIFLHEIDVLLQRIVSQPYQFPEIFPMVHRGLLHRFPYSVYFHIEPESIVVFAILHQHRDSKIWQRRR